MAHTGRIIVGYEAVTGVVTKTVGTADEYHELSQASRDQIIADFQNQLSVIFSKAQPGAPNTYPPKFYETWDDRTDIPDDVTAHQPWLNGRLDEATNDGNNYDVNAEADAIRYVQNGDERICEHYFNVKKGGSQLELEADYNDGAVPESGKIKCKMFAVVRF